MFPGIVQSLLVRELRALRRNIELYPDDASVWSLPPGISNSAGTLVLHLAGNIQHYVGKHLGGSSYVRDRPTEFSTRDVPRSVLLAEIDAAIAAAERGVRSVSADALEEKFPEAMNGRNFTTGDMLVHLAVHLGYHLGQVDYHRRLVTGDNRQAGALSLAEMPEYRGA